MAEWVHDFFSFGLYKRSQGRVTRQVTFAALAIGAMSGCYQLANWLAANHAGWSIEYWLPAVLLVLGVWFAYRVVNLPRFADFLIAVEIEMGKVSWPSQGELVRASVVVLFMLLLMAGLLFGFDFIWRTIFWSIGLYGKHTT